MTRERLRVVHVSWSDSIGGAARAASTLHESMLQDGIDSLLVVGQRDSPHERTIAPGPLRFRFSSELDRAVWRLTQSPRPTWRSPALFGSLKASWLNHLDADIINLHWVTNGLMTIRQIGRIKAPVVWSMYDMWPFSGSEHYNALPERFQHDYARGTRPSDEAGIDLDRWTWKRKSRHWKKPITMVPASHWLESTVKASSLMSHWPVTRIPHVSNMATVGGVDRTEARAHFSLPQEKVLIAFLSTGGIVDKRKGWEQLREAIQHARHTNPAIEVLAVGPPSSEPQPFPVHWLGELRGQEELQRAYASADVVATPSLQDTMPLAAIEAQMLGRAVVAFDIGGLSDIVAHGETGYLAPAFDTNALGQCLLDAIHNEASLGARARARARALWSPTAVVPAYCQLYASLIGNKPYSRHE